MLAVNTGASDDESSDMCPKCFLLCHVNEEGSYLSHLLNMPVISHKVHLYKLLEF